MIPKIGFCVFKFSVAKVSLPVVRQEDKQEPASCHAAKHHLLAAKELNVEGINTKTALLRMELAIVILLKSHAVKFPLNIYVRTHGPALLSAAVSEQMLAWYSAENEP